MKNFLQQFENNIPSPLILFMNKAVPIFHIAIQIKVEEFA